MGDPSCKRCACRQQLPHVVANSRQSSCCSSVVRGPSDESLTQHAVYMNVWSRICTGSCHAAPWIPQPADVRARMCSISQRYFVYQALPSVLCHTMGAKQTWDTACSKRRNHMSLNEDLETSSTRPALYIRLHCAASPHHPSASTAPIGCERLLRHLGILRIGGRPLTVQPRMQRQQSKTA